MAARRFVLGLEGPELTDRERVFFAANLPLGFVLYERNLESAPQAAELITRLRALGDPAPLLFVDQEGGTVDRLGPILGARFPSASACAAKGTDFVHESAHLMGRAARLLGFDVDFAPCVDLGQPKTGAVILEGRTFGFHAEDVVLSGMMFVHGLARAGVATCLKHFPGLGRGGVDSHEAMPVVDAHDVDLMVTDVAPFTKLHRLADGVMVSHAAYPGFTVDEVPASMSPKILSILRGPLGYDGVVYSDDLTMGALRGSPAERAHGAALAGCDVLCLSRPFDAYEEAVARVAEMGEPPEVTRRLDALRRRCSDSPRLPFDEGAWERLREETVAFVERLLKPRERRVPEDDFA